MEATIPLRNDPDALFDCLFQPNALMINRTACGKQWKRAKDSYAISARNFHERYKLESTTLKHCLKCQLGERNYEIMSNPTGNNGSTSAKQIEELGFDPITHKICSVCKKPLPVEDFGWKHKKLNKRESQCKSCEFYKKKKNKVTLQHDISHETQEVEIKKERDLMSDKLLKTQDKNRVYLSFIGPDTEIYSKISDLAVKERRTMEQQIILIVEQYLQKGNGCTCHASIKASLQSTSEV